MTTMVWTYNSAMCAAAELNPIPASVQEKPDYAKREIDRGGVAEGTLAPST